MPIPQLDPISTALARAMEYLRPVVSEVVAIDQAASRVLAEPVCADRDSPPMSVSAMDGYAVRIEDCLPLAGSDRPLGVVSVARAGYAPVELLVGQAVQIFTGAPVPFEADCVIRREDTIESPGEMRLAVPASSLRAGQNIRTRGENIRAGSPVVPAGHALNAASIAAIASFGCGNIAVRRQVRVSILTSGDELVAPGEPANPWQIRDSNSATLRCWLGSLPWVHQQFCSRMGDSLDQTRRSLEAASSGSDAIIVTGGVSAGDTDYVVPALQSLGGQVVFHRLPIRPGRPVLVAMLGQVLVVGLPGNPVSAAVTSRVVAEPLLARLAGLSRPPTSLLVRLSSPDEKQLDLFWFRLIKMGDGEATLVDSQGSGDLVSLARSDGFVQIPPGCSGSGPWRTWLW